ncbi:hypothetical protein EB008_05115 [bacterium]|nr:hypothetical protein [bacterium]
MVVGQFLTPSVREGFLERPILSSAIALVGITALASFVHSSFMTEEPMEYSLKKMRDGIDSKIFFIWEKVLDISVVNPLKKWLPLGKESHFGSDESEALEREAQEEFAKKGLSLTQILTEAKEVLDFQEEIKVNLEKSKIAATSSGICPKKITLNLDHIADKTDALFFLGHELGHSINEDILKSHVTTILSNGMTVYQLFKLLLTIDDPETPTLSLLARRFLPILGCLYVKHVQERHVEFRADRHGLFLLHAKQKLKSLLEKYHLKITPEEALKSATSWPNPPGYRESVHFRYEEGMKMSEDPNASLNTL